MIFSFFSRQAFDSVIFRTRRSKCPKNVGYITELTVHGTAIKVTVTLSGVPCPVLGCNKFDTAHVPPFFRLTHSTKRPRVDTPLASKFRGSSPRARQLEGGDFWF